MKFNRKDLMAALDAVRSGLGSKNKVEQSTCFVFIDGQVYTFNDEIAVSHPVKLEDFKGAVMAKEFYATLNKAKDDELEITVNEGGVVVTGKKFKAHVKLVKEILLPINEIELPEEDGWHELPGNFSEAALFCSFTARKDLAKPILTYIDVNGSQAQSCDDYRLTRFELDSPLAFPILFPANAAAALEEFDPVEYGMSGGWLHFLAQNGSVFSCRTSGLEDYPDVSFIMDMKGTSFQFPDDTKAMIDKASIFTGADSGSNEAIVVSVTKSHMKVKGEGDVGWIEETSRVRYKGDDVTFSINPSFLKAIIGHSKKAEIGDGRLKFIGDGFVHVVCLMAASEKPADGVPF